MMMNRCEAHGLATAPDGLCTLCRRHQHEASSRRLGVILGVTIASTLALGLLFAVGKTVLEMSRDKAAPTASAETATGAGAHVTVYTTKWCPACRATRKWLEQHQIAYDDRDVESDPAASAAFRKLGGRTVPMFDIDGQIKAGFDPAWVASAIEKSEARRAER
jgi:glutaredoxin